MSNIALDPVQIEILRMLAKASCALTTDELTILLNLRIHPHVTKSRLQQLCGIGQTEDFDQALHNLIEDKFVTVSDRCTLAQVVA